MNEADRRRADAAQEWRRELERLIADGPGRKPNRACGTRLPNHKLNDYEVQTIRSLWPSHSFAVIGRMYGISKQQAHRIVRGVKWKHVEQDTPSGTAPSSLASVIEV
jgi:hypothetical protein